jgi:hypothetical protein
MLRNVIIIAFGTAALVHSADVVASPLERLLERLHRR